MTKAKRIMKSILKCNDNQLVDFFRRYRANNKKLAQLFNLFLEKCERKEVLELEPYNERHANVLRMLHPCLGFVHKVEDSKINCLDSEQKACVRKHYKPLPPNTVLAWRCYVLGCHDGTFRPKDPIEFNKYQDKYLNSSYQFDHENDVDSMERADVDFLISRGIL